jgi:hypothetical protein
MSLVTKAQRERRRRAFCETMRDVAPGDPVLSFYSARIGAIGVAVSICHLHFFVSRRYCSPLLRRRQSVGLNNRSWMFM